MNPPRLQLVQSIWATEWVLLKTLCSWNLEQMTLLPLSPCEWLLDDNQMYVLLDLIHTLDFSEARDPRGGVIPG